MGSKVIRNITKVFRSASGVLFGRSTAGTGRGEELTPSQVRSLLAVYTVTQTDTAISTAVNNLIGGSPGLLDTLDELAAALGDDANFASTVTTSLAGKQATLVSGTNIKTINSTSLLGSGNIAIAASPAGSSGQVQFNDAGAFGGATAVVYATTVTHVTITSQGATLVPLCVKGAASQSGNLLESRNSSNTIGARVTAACNFSNAVGGSGSEQFGDGATAGTFGTALGNAATTGYSSLAAGRNARANGAGHTQTALGDNTQTAGYGSVAIGASVSVTTNVTVNGGIAIGSGVTAGPNQLVIGSIARNYVAGHDSRITEVFVGSNAVDTVTGNITYFGTGGSGTNIAGSSVKWSPGRSTGNATPATFTIQRTVAGSSGSTVQTLSDAVQVDGNTTSGETPMLLLDIAKGTLQRVSIGASDSGGTGFKVLRVPN